VSRNMLIELLTPQSPPKLGGVTSRSEGGAVCPKTNSTDELRSASRTSIRWLRIFEQTTPALRATPPNLGGESRRVARLTFVHWTLLAVLALAPTAVLAQEQKQPEDPQVKTETVQVPQKAEPAQPDDAQPKKDEEGKLINVPGGKALGMSILGNQEAPKALVIVPWKSSELGNVQGISTLLDDSRQPIDKDVFMRTLSYYEIRSEAARPDGVPAKTNAAQPKTATPRRK
jgi:hypothetical protein